MNFYPVNVKNKKEGIQMTRKTVCAKCNVNDNAPSKRYCKPCHALYMRGYRKKFITRRIDESSK